MCLSYNNASISIVHHDSKASSRNNVLLLFYSSERDILSAVAVVRPQAAVLVGRFVQASSIRVRYNTRKLHKKILQYTLHYTLHYSTISSSFVVAIHPTGSINFSERYYCWTLFPAGMHACIISVQVLLLRLL